MKLSCAICDSRSDSRFFQERSGVELVRCKTCGLVYLGNTEDMPDNGFFHDAQQHYDQGPKNKDSVEYWGYPKFYEKYRSIFDTFFEDRWVKIQKIKRQPSRLLDIGCGYGLFLEYMKDKIPYVQGLDLDDQAVAYLTQVKQMPVLNCKVEDYQPEKRFDCIVMCDVLEHVMNPKTMIDSCAGLLNDGGLLFIQVPNLVGFKLPLGHTWGLPHHVWQFGPSTLKRLLESRGFTVAAWYTGVMGIIGSYERGGPSISEKMQWALARALKIGNRLQMLAIKKTIPGKNRI